MYCWIVRQYCEPGSVIYLKAHPGETLPRNAAIMAQISGEFEIVEVDPRIQAISDQFASRLVNGCVPICMSYPTVSLKYLYGRDVVQPCDDAWSVGTIATAGAASRTAWLP